MSSSSLGNHSVGFENFEGSQTLSLVSLPKSSKNIESHTANIRMLLDSNAMEGIESKLDSTNLDSRDSMFLVESARFLKELEFKSDSTRLLESFNFLESSTLPIS